MQLSGQCLLWEWGRGRAGAKLWIGKDPSWEVGVGMGKVETVSGGGG